MLKFEDLFNSMKFKDTIEERRLSLLFTEYISDLPDNFYLNQFDLQKKYDGSTYEDWVRILTHPAFNSWKNSQVTLIAETSTDRALASGDLVDKDAVNLLKIKKDVLDDSKKESKPVIIVIPESMYFTDESKKDI